MELKVGCYYAIKGDRPIPFQVVEETDERYILFMVSMSPSKAGIDKNGIIWMLKRDMIEEISEDQAASYSI